ncbi:abnB [Acrasis kona]|uniref:AbnB n=1 Tax=Acrasis kona TaxID=1008807 RepID=A0AAW2ZJ92_9EUKA
MNAFGLIVYIAVLGMAIADYQNPTILNNVPDPGVHYDRASDQYYVVTTSSLAGIRDQGNFPIHTSKNLANWTHTGYAFPKSANPKWGVLNYWAPEIHTITPGLHHLYFTARDANNVLCIGVATAKNLLGPYKDAIGKPLVYNAEMGYIDATIMRNKKDIYLVWKSDGNAVGKRTPIWSAKLNADGFSFAEPFKPVQLLTNDLQWEGPLVEAPWHLYKEPYHYIFYSANAFHGNLYAVGVARSKQPEGPYEKHLKPILTSNEKWSGPGHCSVVTTRQGKYVMVYHAWPKNTFNLGRNMLVDEMFWDESNWPYFKSDAPSWKPKPIPL